MINPIVQLQKDADPNPKQILAEIADRLFEAQDLIVEEKLSKQAVLDEKENFNKKIVQYEQTMKDSHNYESHHLLSRITVIIPKEPNTSPYAKEWYCKKCFDDLKKVELRHVPKSFDMMKCPGCGADIWLAGGDVTLRAQHFPSV